MKKLKIKKIAKYDGSDIKKVSVIVPNYNYEKFIIQRLDSIINQSYPIHELIVLDDCSTDNSVEVIKRRLSKTKINYKIIVNEKNSGSVFSQWQKGLENISGDYFWIAEADDTCEPDFIEKLVTAFDDKEVVLSYCESARIDGKNNIICPNSHDLSDIFHTGEWDKDFIIDGNEVIKNKLSYTNTILNVSSVLWKNNKNYYDIFEEAKKYHVAGDWYIYFKVLQNGKLAFCHESLNYYRKHGSSVSTDVKADTEYCEIKDIQGRINEYVSPSDEIIFKQNIRKSFMLDSISEKHKKELSKFKRYKIAIVLPYPVRGSGGHRTVIQNANALVHYGYDVSIYVEEDYVNTNEMMKKMIEDYYGRCDCAVFVGLRLRTDYDLVFATAWTTAEAVRNMKVPKKAYFIQDYEPWFEPMGYSYIVAENSYQYGFKFVTIGRWLANKISNEFHQPAKYFNFCAQLDNYYVMDKVKKENAICFIFQPEKWRRCAKMGADALRIVKKKHPEIKIYLYGSQNEMGLDFEVENLHIISIEECRKLYNKCKVGICISSSNPSRIPFEMMACGLPVVDLYRENNLYDMPDEGVMLAESNAEAIATAILKIYENAKLQEKMSKFGRNYMSKYDLKYGYDQFISAVKDMLEDNYDNKEVIEPIYKKEGVKASEEFAFEPDENAPALYTADTSGFVRGMVRLKRRIKRKLRLR